MHLSFFPAKKKLEINTEIRDDKTFYLCNGFSYEEIEIGHVRGLKVKAIKDSETDFSKEKFEKSINNMPVISMNGCYEEIDSLYFPDYDNSYKIIDADFAFKNCYNLRNIPKLPDTIETMNGSFIGCTTLLSHVFSLNLPKNLREANDCFADCCFTRKIKKSYLPKNLKSANRLFGTVHLGFVNGLLLNDNLKTFSCSLILSDNHTILDIILNDNKVKIRKNVQRFFKVRKHDLNHLINVSVKEIKNSEIHCKEQNIYGTFSFNSSSDAVSFIRFIFNYYNRDERPIKGLEEFLNMLSGSIEDGDLNLLFD